MIYKGLPNGRNGILLVDLKYQQAGHMVYQMQLGPFTQFHFQDGVHVLSVRERNFHDLHITSSFFFHDPVESCHDSVKVKCFR